MPNFILQLSRFFLITLIVILPFAITGQEKSLFDAIYNEDKEIEVVLEANLDTLMQHRAQKDRVMGVFTIKDFNDTDISFDVEMEIRGRFRRMFSKFIPPLTLHLRKKQLKEKGFNDFNDFKLVPFYYEDKTKSMDILMREFTIYRMYNALTPISYRVQLVKIKYIDTKMDKDYNQYAFLIEDVDELRERVGAKKVEDEVMIEPEMFDSQHRQFVALFQYMIGNSDCDLDYYKNIKVIDREEKLVCIPYDFDFSGMVDAPYAVPDNAKGINSIRERIFLGDSDDPEELKSLLRLFEYYHEKFKEVIDNTHKLNRTSKRYMKAYLDTYYEDVALRVKHSVGLNTKEAEIVKE